MANVASPYGLYPRRCFGSRRCTQGGTAYPVNVNNTAALFWGAPVHLTAGVITGTPPAQVTTPGTMGVGAIAASPTTTPGVNNPIGVMAGAMWEDADGVHFSSWLPANVITNGGLRVVVTIMDDPDLVWMVQANGPMTLDNIGQSAGLKDVNLGNLNTLSHRSKCALDTTTIANAGVQAVRIVRVLDPGAPFSDVLVQFNHNIHQYQTNV